VSWSFSQLTAESRFDQIDRRRGTPDARDRALLCYPPSSLVCLTGAAGGDSLTNCRRIREYSYQGMRMEGTKEECPETVGEFREKSFPKQQQMPRESLIKTMNGHSDGTLPLLLLPRAFFVHCSAWD
jgi:hypothetical protein